MKVYGDLLAKGLFPFASGQTSDEITKVARKKYIYRSNTTSLGTRKFEMMTPSGSVLPGSTKRYTLQNVNGRIFLGGTVPNKLYEYNVEDNSVTEILATFNPSHWYFIAWQNMIIGPDETYDVLTGTSYSHATGPNKYCRPFEYNGKLYEYAGYAGWKYNTSEHKWDAVDSSDFKSFNFSNYTDETGVSSRSTNILQAATHNGKLYIIGCAITGEGMNHNTVFTWDGQKIKSIATAKFTQGSDADGPWSIFRAGGKLWVVGKKGDIYSINHQNTLTKEFICPQNGLFGFHPMVYFGDEVISTVREMGTTWLVNDFAVYAFNGSRFAEIGDWDSQFPGCGIEGMTMVNGYLYVMGGVHLVPGTAFIARIYIGDLTNYDDTQKRIEFEVDRNIGSNLAGIAERTMASGLILDQRHKLLNRFRIEASGDLYGDSASRGWELMFSNWASERRPYYFGSFQGKLYAAGTDLDLLWRFNLNTRTVTSLGSMTGSAGDQGRDADGFSLMEDYFWTDISLFDGSSIIKPGSPSITATAIRKFRNEIYMFDSTKHYRFLRSNNTWSEITSPIWAAFSSIAGAITHMIECRSFAFIYNFTNKKIYKWNGDPNVAAVEVFVDAAASNLGLMTLNNEVYIFTNGGTNAGRVLRYNWFSGVFDSLGSCGYNVQVHNSRYPAGVIKDGCAYLGSAKIADATRKLIKFNGLKVAEVDSMPNNNAVFDLTLHNGDIFMVEYNVSAYQSKIYRYKQAPLHQGSDAVIKVNKAIKDINSIKCPPSGLALPADNATGFAYGDSFYHTVSGFYRRGINKWESQGKQTDPIRVLPSGDGTTTINWNNGTIQDIVLYNSETLSFINPKDGEKYTLIVHQPDAEGSKTITWPANIKWRGGVAPTLTTAASGIDVVSMIYANRVANYYADISLDFK